MDRRNEPPGEGRAVDVVDRREPFDGRQGLLERADRVDVLGAAEQSVTAAGDRGMTGAALISVPLGRTRRVRDDLEHAVEFAILHQDIGEIDQQLDPQVGVLGQQCRCPPQQVGGRREVPPSEGTTSR